MSVLQFETLHGKPNHKQEKIKSMQYMCATWHNMIPKSTNFKITGQNENKWIDTKMSCHLKL
jgi:hypothetical protein